MTSRDNKEDEMNGAVARLLRAIRPSRPSPGIDEELLAQAQRVLDAEYSLAEATERRRDEPDQFAAACLEANEARQAFGRYVRSRVGTRLGGDGALPPVVPPQDAGACKGSRVTPERAVTHER